MSDPSQSNDPPVPNVAPRKEPQVARFVSKIKNLDVQIGEHVLAAVQHPDTLRNSILQVSKGWDGTRTAESTRSTRVTHCALA